MTETARLSIVHETRYRFPDPTPYGVFQLRVRPRSSSLQLVESWEVCVEGGQVEAEMQDQHGNHMALVCLLPNTEALVIRAAGTVSVFDQAGVLGAMAGPPKWLYRRLTPLTAPGEVMRELASSHGSNSGDVLAALHALASDIGSRIRYDIERTDVATTAEQALLAGRGVCQDHAHVFVGTARLMGVPARYVGEDIRLDDRVNQDAGHAWAEAYVPDLGWVGFDISNGISPDNRYVRVATGLDYSEAAPVTGLVLGGAGGDLSVSVAVQQQ